MDTLSSKKINLRFKVQFKYKNPHYRKQQQQQKKKERKKERNIIRDA